MRAFVAIELPQSIRAALARAQERFRAVCPDARWTRPEGIHLTLKFLGQISDAQVELVKNVLHNLGAFQKFAVRVEGFGFFPDVKHPRVFWAGLGAPPDLAQLAARVENALAPLGFPPEDRSFKPHLTLARFKIPHPQPRLQSLLSEQQKPFLGTFEVSEFLLWESRLSPQGAEYRQVACFPYRLPGGLPQ